MNPRPLKILITDPHLKGGGQVRYVTNLARELTRAGHQVTVGCKLGSILKDAAKSIGSNALDRFVFRGGLRPQAWLHDLREVARFIQRETPDLIHVNGSQDHWVAALANRWMGQPVCLVRTRHNTYPVRDSVPNRWLNLRGTDYHIVVCNVVRETLAKQRTFDAARMRSIHNGVDTEQFRPDPHARAEARAEFGYGPDDLVCGIAARLVEAKGHLFLLRAVASLRKDLPQVRVLVIGRGEREPALKQYVKDAGLGDMVTFAGFKDHMAYYVQALDIGVQPSIDCDTSSFSLKEQMAAEKPVIASDFGGLMEIVTDGVEGIVVPAGTVEPLAQAIRTLAQHPQLRESMGKAGRQRVLRDFTIEGFAAQTMEAYRRAIEIHHERAAH